MIYPIGLLVEGQELVCAGESETVREALAKMIEKDFSQLPITDSLGRLTGLISEQSIARSLYHVGDDVGLLDLAVSHCQEKPETLSLESGVLDALTLLKSATAVIIEEDGKPCGIVTTTDLITFFRDYSEGLALIEDMETTLRQAIDAAYRTDEERAAALDRTFSQLRKDSGRPIAYDRLTLGDYISLIVNGENWQQFEGRFESKKLFQSYMGQVREIRNQLTHFRGRLGTVQYDVLGRAYAWLNERDRRFAAQLQTIQLEAHAIATTAAVGELTVTQSGEPQASGKYGPLQDWLKSKAGQMQAGTRLGVTFADIEILLGDHLPESAKVHRAWWSNHAAKWSQSASWLRAGWEVAEVDFTAATVVFRRTNTARYQTFWVDLVGMLREKRPGLTRAEWTSSTNWWQFGAGKAGVYLGWSFSNTSQFTTNVIIETGDRSINEQLQSGLYKEREAIEEELGYALTWDRSPKTQYRVIGTAVPGSIHESDERLNELKNWGLEQMLKFVTVLQPRIREL